MSDAFKPKVAEGAFSHDRERFFFQGSVSTLSAWADACGVDYPRDDGWNAYCHLSREGVLPLDAEDIGHACRDLFGEPRPSQDRGFPGSADWVVSTPVEGIYLTVNLGMEPEMMFGWGEVMARAIGVSPSVKQDAIATTLKAVRAAMEPSASPSL